MSQRSVVVAWSVLLASGCGGSTQPVQAPALVVNVKAESDTQQVKAAEETSCPEGMAWIEGGEFTMGSNEGEDDEKPEHRVSVEGYCMDVTEVTVEAYDKCVSAGGCTTTGFTTDVNELCNWERSERSQHPINCVDWNQAQAYCRWAGKGLPSEEQWEYAARGREGRRYPWGDAEPSEQLCWKRDSEAGTCAVGSYRAGDTPGGLKDMAGNVLEWTSSGYSENYNTQRSNEYRVVRGGCWIYDESALVRGAYRSRGAPSLRYDILGFRCAREKSLDH